VAPAREADSLAHADEPEALAGLVTGEAASIVGHCDLDRAVALDDGDADPLRARVLGDVGQRLLHDPVDRGLDQRREPGRLLPRVEPKIDVELGIDPRERRPALRERLQRRPDAELVQRRRAHVRDEAAHRLDACVDVLDRLGDGGRQILGLHARERSETQLHRGELLQAVVVQLARPAPPLELGGLDAAFEGLRLHRLGGRDRGRRAGRERLHEPLVLGAELRASGDAVERRHHPHRLIPEHERHEQAGLRPDAFGQPEPQPSGGVGEAFGAARPEDLAAQ